MKKLASKLYMSDKKRVFQKLKEIFTKKPVSSAPNLDKKMRIEVNISNYATEKVLSMECEDRQWKLVAYL